ncbi:MAG: hypothetical protein EZS28_003772 [Streblomastix strix]|uniref:Uncharacterized protein n=1 Tax=Streblomastix strix TaxID=222440 RepID=A0A5J4X0J6_9EUKA|nr:MAG: hypothetical protein EZS28_003772 [Streblomastix strix]
MQNKDSQDDSTLILSFIDAISSSYVRNGQRFDEEEDSDEEEEEKVYQKEIQIRENKRREIKDEDEDDYNELKDDQVEQEEQQLQYDYGKVSDTKRKKGFWSNQSKQQQQQYKKNKQMKDEFEQKYISKLKQEKQKENDAQKEKETILDNIEKNKDENIGENVNEDQQKQINVVRGTKNMNQRLRSQLLAHSQFVCEGADILSDLALQTYDLQLTKEIDSLTQRDPKYRNIFLIWLNLHPKQTDGEKDMKKMKMSSSNNNNKRIGNINNIHHRHIGKCR